MNEFALDQLSKNYNPACGDLLTMAERELSAFFRAVTELFGAEQAQVSAEDWIHELEATSDLPSSASQWRRFTVNVLARLASLYPEAKGQDRAMGNRSSAALLREPIGCGA